MQSINYSLNIIRYIVICSLFILFTSCKSDKSKKKSTELNLEDFITEDDIFNDVSQAKKIFYSLPSPLETAMLIKSAGADYDEELLNSLDNVDNYSTNMSMALNLGIYTTDLSFASLFDQTQTSINYMEAAKRMAEGLDIVDAINNETIKRLERNLNNRDIIMDIISETFLNSSSYLKENDRQGVASIVLVGGWIEGLYIATQLVGDKPIENNKLVDRISEQKLSFNIVQRMLEDNRKNESGEEDEDIVELMVQLTELKKVFDKIKVETSEVKIEPGDETQVTTLKSQTKITITAEVFNELKESINVLRTNFIQ
jgi:hypothetical protein